MQRGKARVRGIRIGVTLEQQLDQIGKAGVRRNRRRGDAPRIRVIHIRASVHEQLRRAGIADARREQQRRVAAVRNLAVVERQAVRRHRHHLAPHVRTRMNVGAVGNEYLHGLGMPLSGGPHERRLASRGPGIRVGALLQERFGNVRFPGSRGDHQRRLAGQQGQVRVGSRLQQAGDDRQAGTRARVPQRGRAEVIRRVDLGARANEQSRHPRDRRDTRTSAGPSCRLRPQR